MNKSIYSFLILLCTLVCALNRGEAQSNFESLLRVAHEKRFISDSYKETHLSALASADLFQQYDFTSLYFYAQGVKKLHGDVYLQFSVSPPDAICSGSVIVRFTQAGKYLEYAIIELNCQQDEESELFVNSEFEFLNDSTIEIRYKEWENIDMAFRNEETGSSYLILGKEKFISSRADPSVEPEPEIYKLSHQLLQKNDLEGLDKAQLRILRNSIFAKYGYVFHSKDLNEHFSSQAWYKKSGKTSQEIMSEMNAIEKMNLQTIKKGEEVFE